MTSLYHLRSAPGASFRITKLDADYRVEATYLVSSSECSCPAGSRPTCRHRQMLPFFLAKGHVDNGWMLDWHTRQWRSPLCEDATQSPIGNEFPTATPVDEMTKEEIESALDVKYEQEEPELSGLQEEQILMGFHNTETKEEPALSSSSSLSAPAEVERAAAPPAPKAGAEVIKRRKI